MLLAVCSVDFHLTQGQRIDSIFPQGALDQAERSAVAFHAFPDSVSFESSGAGIRDTFFWFRTPRTANEKGNLYGFVFCRQRRDKGLPRGGEQKSIVLLSAIPLANVFWPLIRHAGPVCLTQGHEGIRQVYQDVIDSCTRIVWGRPLELVVAGASLQFQLPELSALSLDAASAGAALTGLYPSLELALTAELDSATGIPSTLTASRPSALFASAFGDTDVYTPFSNCLSHLWALWEIMLLGEPLLLVSPTPTACSMAIAALLSLTAPFPYCADYRPYFTIQDRWYGVLGAGKDSGNDKGPLPHPPALLGITNPQMKNSLTPCPNILATGYSIATQPTLGRSSHSSEEGRSSAKPSGSFWDEWGRPHVLQRWLQRFTGKENVDFITIGYKPLTSPDEAVLRELATLRNGDLGPSRRRRLGAVNSKALRRHFHELTRGLLQPLIPLISPVSNHESQSGSNPSVADFDADALIEGVANGTVVVPDVVLRRFKDRFTMSQFYSRWLRSPSFSAWLETRRKTALLWKPPA